MIANEQAAISAGQAVASKRSTTWWPLAVLVAINVLNFYDRQVAGAIVEPVRKEFHLTDTEIGGLNFAFTMLYGLVGLPLDFWQIESAARNFSLLALRYGLCSRRARAGSTAILSL